jgi:hypothetical protein
VYEVPQTEQEIMRMKAENETELQRLHDIKESTRLQIIRILRHYADPHFSSTGPSLISELKWYILKEKAIYHNMNCFVQKGNVYHGECWIPVSMEYTVRE